MKRFFQMMLCAVLALTLLLNSFALAEGAVTVTDQIGRTIELAEPAQTVVSCYYLSTATLLALGAEDKLVGIEMKADTRALYQLAAPELIELPAVGSGKGVNLEEIAKLNPDVVILPKKLKDEIPALESLGLKVVIVNPESQPEFEASVALLGDVTGTSDRADALLERFAAITGQVRAAVADAERPSVYMAAGSDFLTTYPAGLYQSDLIDIAGGINVAAELTDEKKVTIDAERLMTWNPDYIFIIADADYTVQDILGDAQYAALSAVQNGRVYAFPSDVEAWDYPTPSSALGQMYLASVLHPELVSNETFLTATTEFYAEVFGIEITPELLGLTA